MAVMTHAPIPILTFPTAAHYSTFSDTVQDRFDQHMSDADNASNDASYFVAMIRAAHSVGIAVPDSFDIAICDCFNNGCGCDLIFDSHLQGAVATGPNPAGGNLSALQCPDCGHDHPRPIED